MHHEYINNSVKYLEQKTIWWEVKGFAIYKGGHLL